MTTTMLNGNLEQLISDFVAGKPVPQPIVFAHALADGLQQNGINWISGDQAKAILQALDTYAYGPIFKIDSQRNLKRLQKVLKNS